MLRLTLDRVAHAGWRFCGLSRIAGEASNEPALLPYIAEDIASCLRVPLAQLARQTTATARSFYGLNASPDS